MGFGPFSSESKSSFDKIDASNQAQVLKGSGKVLSANAVDLSKAAINYGFNVKNLKAAKGANITIGDSSAAVSKQISDLADQVNKSGSTLTAQTSDVLQGALSRQAAVTSDALNKVAALTESQQTGGASTILKTLLWIVGLAVAGFFLFKTLK